MTDVAAVAEFGHPDAHPSLCSHELLFYEQWSRQRCAGSCSRSGIQDFVGQMWRKRPAGEHPTHVRHVVHVFTQQEIV